MKFCDDKLKAVMGGKDKVTMFTKNEFIAPHLLEKLDKSYYTHKDEDEDEDGAVLKDGVSEGLECEL
jgi:chromatin remodeling complex protein RSC6